MPGTREGGLKAAKTNMKRQGKDFYSRIGRIGGQNGNTGGFAAMSHEKRVEAGRKGGRRSSRAGIRNGEGKTPRRIKH